MDDTKLYAVMNEDFLLEIYEKITSEIQKAKINSKSYQYQELALDVMKIGTKGNFKKLFGRGDLDLSKLDPWLKAEGYRKIADFISASDSKEYSAYEYYTKSYTHWEDTLLNKREPIVNLTGSAIRLIQSLKKNHQTELLEKAGRIYPQFLDQISKVNQPRHWLEFALEMVNAFPNSKIHQLMRKAEEISSSDETKKDSQFSMNRFILELEIAKAKKNLAKIEELSEEIQKYRQRYDMGEDFDIGMVSPEGQIYSNSAGMNFQAVLFAKIFFDIDEPKKGLKTLDDRLSNLIKQWEKHEKEGGIEEGAQKMLMLMELITIGETLVQHNYIEECQKLKPFLTQKFDARMLPNRIQLDNLLANLGWYSESDLSERVNQTIRQFKPFLSMIEKQIDLKSPMVSMQISQKSAEILMLESLAEKIGAKKIKAQIEELGAEFKAVLEKVSAKKAPDEKKKLEDERSREIPKVHLMKDLSLLMEEKKFEEAKPLINEYEKKIRQQLPNIPPQAQSHQLMALASLYLTCKDFDNAKRILTEVEGKIEEKKDKTEPKTPRSMYPGMPSDIQAIQQKRFRFGLLAMKIKIDSQTKTLDVNEILKDVPEDDTDFLYQLGMEFAKNGEINGAEEILTRIDPSDDPIRKDLQNWTSSHIHLLKARIFSALGEKDKAIKELDQSYEMKREPYEILANLNKYLEVYFELGEKEKALAVIETIFESINKDTIIQGGMGFPIPKWLFNTTILAEKDPEKHQLQNLLRSRFHNHMRKYYENNLPAGKDFRNFQSIIMFIRTLIALKQEKEALELARIILNTLNELVAQKEPKIAKIVQKSNLLDETPRWNVNILFRKLHQDPITVPGAMDIRDIMFSTPFSPMATEQEKRPLSMYKYMSAYQMLHKIFKKLEHPQLENLCKENSKRILESLEELKADVSSINLFSEIEDNLSSQQYSQAKDKIRSVIQALDGIKIKYREGFSPYISIFNLLVLS